MMDPGRMSDGSDSDSFVGRPGGGMGMGDMMMLPVTATDIRDNRESIIPEVFPHEEADDPTELSGLLRQDDLDDASADDMKEVGHSSHRSISLSNNRSNSRSQSSHKPRINHNRQPSSVGGSYSVPCRYDICYFTSSPLVFGDAQVKPFPQLNVREGRTAFYQMLDGVEKQTRMIHLTANTRNLIEAVTAGCHVLHYVGHVIKDYLAFEDRQDIGKQHLLHWDKLRQIIECDTDRRLSLVFAVGSNSQDAAKCFAQAGVAHVVGVSGKFDVADVAASFFTKHFYYALFSGHSILRSFQTASGAVAAMPSASGSSSSSRHESTPKFILLPEDADHNMSIFTHLMPGQVEATINEDCPNNLPPPVQPFVGREIDMRHIAKVLLADQGRVRLVILESQPGVGKSATAQMIGKYCCDRGIFPGGVFLLKKTRGTQTLEDMLRVAIQEGTHSEGGGEDLDVATWLRKEQRKKLFILDEVQDISDLRELLRNIFDLTHADTKVLMTWPDNDRVHVPEFANALTRYWTLDPLSDQNAAKLFARSIDYAFSESAISRNADIMKIIKQSPAKSRQLTNVMEDRGASSLDELAELYIVTTQIRQKFRKKPTKRKRDQQRQEEAEEKLAEYILDGQARRVWTLVPDYQSMSVRYDQLYDVLNGEYHNVCPHRPLYIENLEDRFKSLGMENGTVHAQHFDDMYKWFKGICDIVEVLGATWYERRIKAIEGFVTRSRAEQELLGQECGTFLVRFASKPRGLAISFRATDRVTHMLMTLQENSENWDIEAYSGDHLQHTLPEFICAYTPLLYVYQGQNAPPCPKAEAF